MTSPRAQAAAEKMASVSIHGPHANDPEVWRIAIPAFIHFAQALDDAGMLADPPQIDN